jgi:hypothetical protein
LSMGWVTKVWFIVWGTNFSLLHHIQISSGTFPACLMTTGLRSPEIQWQEYETGHSSVFGPRLLIIIVKCTYFIW